MVKLEQESISCLWRKVEFVLETHREGILNSVYIRMWKVVMKSGARATTWLNSIGVRWPSQSTSASSRIFSATSSISSGVNPRSCWHRRPTRILRSSGPITPSPSISVYYSIKMKCIKRWSIDNPNWALLRGLVIIISTVGGTCAVGVKMATNEVAKCNIPGAKFFQ